MEITLLENVLLSDFGPKIVSVPTEVPFSAMVMTVRIVKAICPQTEGLVDIWVEGSYDGRTWLTTGLPSVSQELSPPGDDVGPVDLVSSAAAPDYSQVRVVAQYSGENAWVSLAFAKLTFTRKH